MATAGCRFSLGMTFSSEAEKDAIKLRVDSARRILFPDESTSQRPDNAALLNAMLDIVLSIPSTAPGPLHHSVHSFLLGHSRYVYYTLINVSRPNNFITYSRHTMYHTPVRVYAHACIVIE